MSKEDPNIKEQYNINDNLHRNPYFQPCSNCRIYCGTIALHFLVKELRTRICIGVTSWYSELDSVALSLLVNLLFRINDQ